MAGTGSVTINMEEGSAAPDAYQDQPLAPRQHYFHEQTDHSRHRAINLVHLSGAVGISFQCSLQIERNLEIINLIVLNIEKFIDEFQVRAISE